MPRLLSHINFPKVVTVLAVTFGVALGACGVTALMANSPAFSNGNAALGFGVIELVVMLLSAAGLVLTAIVWFVVALVGDRAAPATTTLFGDHEEKK